MDVWKLPFQIAGPSWYGHVQRATSYIKSVTDLAIPGARGRGRPRNTWSECVKNDVRECGLSGIGPQSRDTWGTDVRPCLVLPTPSNMLMGHGQHPNLKMVMTNMTWYVNFKYYLILETYSRFPSFIASLTPPIGPAGRNDTISVSFLLFELKQLFIEYAFLCFLRSCRYVYGLASTNKPVQFRTVSNAAELLNHSPSSAPHSKKKPFVLWFNNLSTILYSPYWEWSPRDRVVFLLDGPWSQCCRM